MVQRYGSILLVIVHNIEIINSSTESNEQNKKKQKWDNRRKKKNEIEEIYTNNHLCYEEAKLKKLESWKDNNLRNSGKSTSKMYFSSLGLLGKTNWQKVKTKSPYSATWFWGT